MSINWFGAYTLFKKEVWRFVKVYHQTLLSPVVNILLFLAVFTLAVGDHVKNIGGVSFPVFVSAGLVMMAAMQNSFANSSSSMVMGRVLGHYIDYIMPPLEAVELLLAYSLGALVRGVMVGVVAYVAVSFFVDISFTHPLWAVFYLIFSCLFLGFLGVLCGIISETFDQMSAVTSYLITPLTFLSGTFYSTKALPEFWQNVAHYNPFFYMIDGFRYSVTGFSDGEVVFGASYILLVNFILGVILYVMLKTGYKIKS